MSEIPQEALDLNYNSGGFLPDVGLYRRGDIFYQETSRSHHWLFGIMLVGAVIVALLPWHTRAVMGGLKYWIAGILVFPLQHELGAVAALRGLQQTSPADNGNSFDHWILTVRVGLRDSYVRHPWLAYGTDWLAFAHVAIAVFFIGPIIDPVRNVWVLRAGMILACAAILAGLAVAVPRAKRRAERIDCGKNLNAIGTAAHLYAGRHAGHLPSDLISMSNELANPKIMICPADHSKPRVEGWVPMDRWKPFNPADSSYEIVNSPTGVFVRCKIHGTELRIDP